MSFKEYHVHFLNCLLSAVYFSVLNIRCRGARSTLQRFKKVQQVLIYVLFLNFGVSFAKIIYGKLTSTLSMTADGYHSLFDGLSNIVGLAGSFIGDRPPDVEHPYGHRKYETVASVFIALLL